VLAATAGRRPSEEPGTGSGPLPRGAPCGKRRLAAAEGLTHVEFRAGRIEEPPVEDGTIDCVISNGVINLSPDKERVFAEAARVLCPGGRLAIADIVTERQLTDAIAETAFCMLTTTLSGGEYDRTFLRCRPGADLVLLRIR
jgi:SAM-dependent methyltransferase